MSQITSDLINNLKTQIDLLHDAHIKDTNTENVGRAFKKMTHLQETINSTANNILLKPSPWGAQETKIYSYIQTITPDVVKKLDEILSHFINLKNSVDVSKEQFQLEPAPSKEKQNPSTNPFLSVSIKSSDATPKKQIELTSNKEEYNNWINPFSISTKPSYATHKTARDYTVGFYNRSCNCWINSLLSMIVFVPGYREAYVAVANHYAQSYNDWEQEMGIALQDALIAYEDARTKQQSVHSSVSQNVRLAFHHLFFDTCSPEPHVQIDAHEAMVKLMQEYQNISKDGAPKLYFSMETKRHYSPVGTERNPDPFHGKYSEIGEGNTSSLTETDFQILLQIKEGVPFETLFSKFFVNPDIGNCERATYELSSGKVQEFKVTQICQQFKGVPREFLLTLERFRYDLYGNSNKVSTPVKVPRKLILPEAATNRNTQITYELDAFIVHTGKNLSSGHYVCYKKFGDQWIEIDDSSVEFVGTEEIEQIACGGYLYHYSKSTNPFVSNTTPTNPFVSNTTTPPNPFVSNTTTPPNPFVSNTTPTNPFVSNTMAPPNPFVSNTTTPINPFLQGMPASFFNNQ